MSNFKIHGVFAALLPTPVDVVRIELDSADEFLLLEIRWPLLMHHLHFATYKTCAETMFQRAL